VTEFLICWEVPEAEQLEGDEKSNRDQAVSAFKRHSNLPKLAAGRMVSCVVK